MATALGLDHIVLVVGDVERALAWYGRHVGLAGDRVEEWRRGEVIFPSLRIDERTLIDLIPGLDAPEVRGHLDHICLVVTPEHLAALAADPDLEVIDEGRRYGAQGDADSIYVRDSEGLTVEFRSYG